MRIASTNTRALTDHNVHPVAALSENAPTGHARHDVLVEEGWYVPASHWIHTCCATPGCTVPGSPRAQKTNPFRQTRKEPTSSQV